MVNYFIKIHASRFKVHGLSPLIYSAFCFLLSAFFLFPFSLFAQQQFIDIDENAQNRVMAAQVQSCDFYPNLNYSHTSIIKNTIQIPAHALYQNLWDTSFIRSEIIDIPFFDNQLKIMLVQEGNTPFAFPISSTVSTGYVKNKGKQHAGVDFSATKREPVVACFDGIVRIAKKYSEYGNTVVIRHYNGLETLYALLNLVCVVTEQIVNAGDLIGYVIPADPLKKNALHFEIRFLNAFFNPEKVINFSERKLQNNILTLMPKDFIQVPLAKPTSLFNQVEKEQSEKEKKVSEPSKTNPVFHTVAKGETIYKICLKYNITESYLKSLNNIKGDKIEIGQKLRVQ